MKTIHWKRDVVAAIDAAGDWAGDAGPPTHPDAIPFNADGNYGNTAFAAGVEKGKGAKLTTLVSFTGADGANPYGSLFADAAGNLLGTASAGGTDSDGTVFEIAKTKKGYAGAPTTLVSFTGADGSFPYASLITDAAGDLLGTTEIGGPDDDGTVFEIAKTKSGYANAPTTLVSYTGADGSFPSGSLITDADGDLLGTTGGGGVDNDGTVFEISKTKSGYAAAPTILYSFTGAIDGGDPEGSLLADADGDLFGTTSGQGITGPSGYGTVFELTKTKTGYASAPNTLVSFTSADGGYPLGSLIADAAGDLFGTTYEGGTEPDGGGTVFEILKTKHGYASTPTTLVNFGGADGANPEGSLIADAAGDLFGTTYFGGADNDGTVFEIAKTKGGYASAPTTLVSFTGADGANPTGDLFADAAGDLFATTTAGGADGDGTVFEITNSGFTPPTAPAQPAAASFSHASPLGAAFAQAMASFGASRPGDTTPTFLASRHETSMQLSRPQVA